MHKSSVHPEAFEKWKWMRLPFSQPKEKLGVKESIVIQPEVEESFFVVFVGGTVVIVIV